MLRGRLDPAAQLAGALILARARGEESAGIGDAGTLCAIVDPDGLGTERCGVRVELGHGFARAQTIVDRRRGLRGEDHHTGHHAHGTEPTQVDVALTVDARGYAALWLGALTG